MSAKKIIYMIESVMVVLTALLLGAAVTSRYREGTAVRESEDVLAWIFTRETLSESLVPVVPFLLCTVLLAFAGLILQRKEDKRYLRSRSANGRGQTPGMGRGKISEDPAGDHRKAVFTEGSGISPRADHSETAGFPDQVEKIKEQRMARIRLLVFAAAVAMIAAGIWNGSMRDVLIKAVNLCTECVGLG